MKTIYLIQIFNLTDGIVTIGKCAFQKLSEACEHVGETKRCYSEIDQCSLEDIDKKYVFNVITVHLY